MWATLRSLMAELLPGWFKARARRRAQSFPPPRRDGRR